MVIPHSKLSNVTCAGKTDVRLEFKAPGADYEGDFIQGLTLYAISADDQAARLYREMTKRCRAQTELEVDCDMGEHKFLQPPARFKVELYKDQMWLVGRGHQHIIKYSNVNFFMSLKGPTTEDHIIIYLHTPIQQGPGKFGSIVLQTRREDDLSVLYVAERVPGEEPVTATMEGQILGVLTKMLQSKLGIAPVLPYKGGFKGKNGAHCIDCTHKQSIGYWYPLNQGVVFCPKPAVYLKHSEIAKIIFLGCEGFSGVRSFGLEVITRFEGKFEFERMDLEDRKELTNYLKTKGIRYEDAEVEKMDAKDELEDEPDESDSEDEEWLEDNADSPEPGDMKISGDDKKMKKRRFN